MTIEDAPGDPVAGDDAPIALSLPGSASTIGGTTTIDAINGVATFTNLRIDQAEAYTIAATDLADSLKQASSNKFTVAADTTSAHLVVTPAASAVVGHAFSPAIGVQEIDSFGNPVLSDSSKITLGVSAGPAVGLAGTTVATLKKARASFSKAIPVTAGNYTLSLTCANASVPTLNFFETVNQAMTTVAVPHVAAAYAFGSTITLTDTFKSNAPSSIPFTGTVAVYDSNNQLAGTFPIAGNGTAKLVLPTINGSEVNITAGSHLYLAVYSGDANHTGFTTGTFTLLIKPATAKTTLVSSATQLTSGQSLTLTATIASTAAPAAPHTGAVTFLDNGGAFGTVTLSGSAVPLTFVPAPGVHKYTAVYSGDVNFVGGISGGAIEVSDNLAPASIAGDGLWLADLTGTGDQGPPALTLASFSGLGNALTSTLFPDNSSHVGSYTYKQSSPTTATVVDKITSGSKSVTITVQMTFTASMAGHYHASYSSGGTVDGSFVLIGNPIPSNAPNTIAGSVITLTATAGSALLGASGTLQLSSSASDNTYTLVGISGSSVNSSGTASYSLVNNAIAAFAYTDSVVGTGTIYLTFTSPTAGVYYNVDSVNDWQSGTFTLGGVSADNA